MANADLSDCRAKLARAKKKLDTLETQIGEFHKTRPYRAEIRQPPPKLQAIMRIKSPPPEDWGIDAGEIATSARSALDYLVMQLSIDSGTDPGIARKRRTQFPIFLDESEYRKGGGKAHRERMLGGVSSAHRSGIDRFQPYQRGRQAAPNDPLAILREISDREKHRELHATLAVMETLTYKTPYDGGSTVVRVHFTEPQPLKDGDILLELDDPIPGIEVGVPGRGKPPDFDIAFRGDRLVTTDDLDRILQRVTEIVEFFQRRIKS